MEKTTLVSKRGSHFHVRFYVKITCVNFYASPRETAKKLMLGPQFDTFLTDFFILFGAALGICSCIEHYDSKVMIYHLSSHFL